MLELETLDAEAVPTRRRQLRHCSVVVEIDSAGRIDHYTVSRRGNRRIERSGGFALASEEGVGQRLRDHVFDDRMT
jgi:hypothetical protein